jgi:hypothetical protein
MDVHMKPLTSVPLLIVLTACAAPDPAREATQTSKTETQVTQAMTAPLTDLNLVRVEVPAVLVAAQRAPYASPVDRACPALATEIRALDAALGADLDTPITSVNPSLIDRSTELASDTAVGSLRRAAESVIPYRGWVRQLSGAERYSKEVRAAIAAGVIRRAYLKGLGQAAACSAPAAPLT